MQQAPEDRPPAADSPEGATEGELTAASPQAEAAPLEPAAEEDWGVGAPGADILTIEHSGGGSGGEGAGAGTCAAAIDGEAGEEGEWAEQRDGNEAFEGAEAQEQDAESAPAAERDSRGSGGGAPDAEHDDGDTADQLAALDLGADQAQGVSGTQQLKHQVAASCSASSAGSDCGEGGGSGEGGTIKAHRAGAGDAAASDVPAAVAGSAGEGSASSTKRAPAPAASLPARPSVAASASASKRRTFTAPPKCLQNRPRTAMRSNYSHSQQRVRQILRDNEVLVARLGEIAFKRPQHERDQEKHDKFMANVAASSAKRRAADARRIMAANLRIYRRLQEVKPSRDVSRVQQDEDYAKHEATLASLAALRRRGGRVQPAWAM